MARVSRLMASAIVIIVGARAGTAQSVFFQPRPDEVMIEPFSLEQVISGVHLSVRVYPFFLVRTADDELEIDARALADLSDVKSKIGDLVDTLPIPIGNLRIWSKDLAIDGNVATLTLKGDVWIDLALITITQPFKATLPFTLAIMDPHTVALKTRDPSVQLDGGLADLSNQILNFVGVDINAKLKEALDHFIGPNLQKRVIPEDLLWLNPAITRAEFLNNSGVLTASLQMNAALDGKALIKFVQAITTHPHYDE